MKRTINSAHSPEWANSGHTAINLMVDFDELDDEFVPFTASPDDTEIHGQELFVRAANGEFGPVAEYVPTPPPSIEECLRQIDTKAESVRLRYITSGAGQASTYIIKQMQAVAFKAAGYSGPVPTFVQAEADSIGVSPQAGADYILAAAQAWEVKGAEIEKVRRKWKVTIESSQNRSSDLSSALMALDVL